MKADDAVAEMTALTQAGLTTRRRETVKRCRSIASAHAGEVDDAAARVARLVIGEYWRDDQCRRIPSALHVSIVEVAEARAKALAREGTDYRIGRSGELIRSDGLGLLEWAGRRRSTAKMSAFRTTAQLQELALVQRRVDEEKPWDPSLQIHQLLRTRLRDDRLRVLDARLTRSEAMEFVVFALEGLSDRVHDRRVSSALREQESPALARRRPTADNELMGRLFGRTLRELLHWMGTYDFTQERCSAPSEEEALLADRLAHSGEVDARLIYLAECACAFVEGAAGFDAPIEASLAGGVKQPELDVLAALQSLSALDEERAAKQDVIRGRIHPPRSEPAIKRACSALGKRGLVSSKLGPGGGMWISDPAAVSALLPGDR